MAKITDEELKALREKHPRGVKVLEAVPEDAPEGAPGDEFVFRKIDRAAHTKYRAMSKRGLAQGSGGDEPALLARELLIWPKEVAEFDQLRERAPGIAEEMGYALLADADAGLTVREGKR
jgi:hypothetical protein